jgi:hypothetical protein
VSADAPPDDDELEVANGEVRTTASSDAPALEHESSDSVPAPSACTTGRTSSDGRLALEHEFSNSVPAPSVHAKGPSVSADAPPEDDELSADEEVRFEWVEERGKRRRVLCNVVRPTPAQPEPIDVAMERGDIVCSPRAAAWSAREVVPEVKEVDPVRAPLTRPLTDKERRAMASAVQYTLTGTPVPGAPARSSPSIQADVQDVQAEFDNLFAEANPPSPGTNFNEALDQLEEDLRSPDAEVVEAATDDPYGCAPLCDMYAALAGALSDDDAVEVVHGEEHRVGFDWVNRYHDEDARDPQVRLGARITPGRCYIGYIRYVPSSGNSLGHGGM